MNGVHTLVFLALVIGSWTSPINVDRSTQCSRTCTGSKKFKYQPGTTYEYKYDGSVLTKMNGVSGETSGLHSTATAHIDVISKCEMVLRLSDVKLKETDPSSGRTSFSPGTNSFRRALEEKQLRFSFQDGRIEDICPAEEEQWVINVKRGILSAFQNAMPDFQANSRVQETDVSGNCEAHYQLGGTGWRSFIITKSKNLMSCTDRDGYRTSLQAIPYRVASDIRSLPLMKSTHSCEQTIHNKGYIMKTVCTEEHIFRPFSRGDNGAVTKATHMLQFIGEQSEVQPHVSNMVRRSTLLFEHDDILSSNARHSEGATKILTSICEQITNEVRPETPKIFAELVYKLKTLNPSALMDLHERVNSNNVCNRNHAAAKKFFHDALTATGTSASVELMSDLIRRRHVVGVEADMWLSSLAFVQQPTRNMLVSVKQLLDSDSVMKNSYLAVSALVNNYCRRNNECARDVTIRHIARSLEKNLNVNCRSQGDPEKERVLYSLKAIGNMGHSPKVIPTLNRCMTETTNPIEIRLAAINSLRRQSCDADRSIVMKLFSDVSEDSEIRIASYLAAMQCADRDLLENVKIVLESEEVKQVGSFVWTHLTNLMETSDPHKQDIRNILEHQRLKKQFDMDKRKFSRNIESSVFFDSINMGAKFESNLVWSPKSFVPRSAMLNLTVDLFGHSVNLMEVGGRVEGMERLLETFFGPKGYFPDNTVSKTIRDTQRSFNEERMKEMENQHKTATGSNEMKGSLYFKVFGHEISYIELQNMVKNEKLNIFDILIKLARDQEYDYTKSLMFLDSTITVPTILGMPLKLAVNGSVTMNVKVKGKMDLRELTNSPRGIDVDGYIKPSSAVEISSMMGVDAFVARSGVKMVTTLHSSTEISGKVSLRNGQIFVANLNMPKDKIEILSVSNKFFMIHLNSEVALMSQVGTAQHKRVCTGEYLQKALGIELCGDLQYTNTMGLRETPLFPLTGPSSISVVLNKKDTHTSYVMEARMEKRHVRSINRQETSYVSRLAFNTPGSKVDRELAFDLLVRPNQVTFNLVSPWKRANVNGFLTNTAHMKKAQLMLTIDKVHKYGLTSEIIVARKYGRITYSPHAELHIAGRKTIAFGGGVDINHGSKIEVDLALENLFDTPVMLKGYIDQDVSGQRSRFTSDMELLTPWLNTKVKGYIDHKLDLYKSRMGLEYQLLGAEKQEIVANYKVRNTKLATMRTMSASVGIRSSQFPDYDFQANWAAQKAAQHMETSFKVTYGDRNKEEHYVDTFVTVKHENRAGGIHVKGTTRFLSSYLGINANMKLTHDYNARGLHSKLDINYTPTKTASVEVNLQNLGEQLIQVSGDVTVLIPGHTFRIAHQVEERQPGELHHNMFVLWGVGKQIQMTTVLKKQNDFYSLTSSVTIPHRAPMTVTLITRLNPKAFRANAEVTYERKKYAGNVEYAFAMEGAHLAMSGILDLVCPSRRVIVAAKLNRLAMEVRTDFNIRWNADRDERMRAGFSGSYRMLKDRVSTKHESAIKITYLTHEYEVKIGAKETWRNYVSSIDIKYGDANFISLKSDLNYINGLTGKVEYRSSGQHVPDAKLIFNHRGSLYDFNSDGELSWGPDKKISTNVISKITNVNKVDVRVSMETPWTIYRKINLHLNHAIESNSISCTINGNVGDAVVESQLTGRIRHTGLEAIIKVKVPFFSTPATGEFKYENSPKRFMANWNFEAESKQIATVLTLQPQWHNFDAKVIIVTPFQKFKRFGFHLNNVIDNSELAATVFGEYNDKKVGFSLVGKSKNNFKNVEATAQVSIPVEGYNDMGVSIKYNRGNNEIHGQASVAWSATQRYGITVFTDYTEAGKCTGNIQLIRMSRKYKYEWNYQYGARDVNFQHLFVWPGNTMEVQFAGTHLTTRYRREIRGKMILKTPFVAMSYAKLDASYINSENRLLAKMVMNVNEVNLINTAMEVNGASLDDTDMEATLACSFYAKPLRISITGQTRQLPYTGKIQAVYGTEQRFMTEVVFKPNGWNDIELSVKLQTPFEIMRKTQIRLTNAITNNQMATAAVLILNSKTYEISITASNRGPTTNRNLQGNIIVKIPNVEPITISVKHTDNGNEFTSGIDVYYEGRRQSSVAMSMLHRRQGWMIQNSGNIYVETPFEGYNSMSYKWKHNNNEKKIQCHNQVMWQEYSAIFNVDGTLQMSQSGLQITGKMFVQLLPSEKLGGIGLEVLLDHEHSSSHINTNFNAKIDRMNIFDATLIATRYDNLVIGMSFALMDMMPLSASVKLNTASAPYTGQAEIKWGNEKNIKGNYRLASLDLMNIDAMLSFSTSLEMMEKINIEFKQTIAKTKFTQYTAIEFMPRKSIVMQIELAKAPVFSSMASISTPFDILRSASIEVTETRMSIVYSGKQKITILGNMNVNPENIDASLKLTSTLEGFEHMEGTVKITDNDNGKKWNLQLKKNYNDIVSISAQYGSEMYILSFKSPYENFRELRISVTERSLNIDYVGSKRVSITAQIPFLSAEKIQATARLTSSILNWETLKAQFQMDRSEYTGEAVLTLEGTNRVEFKGKYDFTQRFVVNVFHMCQLLTVKGNVDMGHDQGVASMEINYMEKTFALNTDYNIQNREAELSVTTPFKDANTISISFKNNALKAIFSGQHQISLTTTVKSLTFEKVKATFRLTTSINNFEKFEGSILCHVQNPDKVNFRVHISTMDTNAIEFRGEIQYRNGVEARIFITTPFHVLQRCSFSLESEKITATFVGNERLSMTAILETLTPRKFKGNLKITTSIPDYENFEGSFCGKIEDNSITVKLNLATSEGNAVKLFGLIDYSTNLKTKLTIHTPFHIIQKLAFTYENNKLTAAYIGKLFGHISITANLDSLSLQNTKASFVLTTSMNDYARLEGSLLWGFQNQKGTLEITMKLDDTNSVRVNGMIDCSDKLSVRLLITTPFPKFQKFILDFGNNQVTATFDGNERVSMTANLESMTLEKIKANLRITTSIDSYKSLEGSFLAEVKDKEFNVMFNLETNPSNVINLQSKVDYSCKPKKMSLIIATPFEILKSFRLLVDLGTTKTVKIEMKAYGEWMLDLTIDRLSVDSSKGHFILNSPFEDYSRISIIIDHSYSSNQLQSLVTVIFNKKQFVASVDRNENGDQLVIDTPFTNFQKLSVLLHSGKKYTLSLNLESKTMPITLESSVEVKTWNDISVQAKGRTSISGLENFDVTYNHKVTDEKLNIAAVVDIPYGKTQMKLNIQNSSPYAFEIDVSSPFNPLRIFRIKLEHNGAGIRFINNFEFEYIAYIIRFKFNNELHMESLDDITAKTRLTTPFLYFEMINFDFSHKKEGENYISALDLEYEPREYLRLKSNINLSSEPSIVLSLTSPLELIKYVTLKAKLNQNWPKVVAQLSYNHNEHLKVKVNAKMETWNEMSLDIDVDTPFSGHSSLRFRHSLHQQALETNLDLKHASKEMTILLSAKLDENPVTELDIKTPFDFLKTYRWKFTLKKSNGVYKYMDTTSYEGADTYVKTEFMMTISQAMNLFAGRFQIIKDTRKYEMNIRHEIDNNVYTTTFNCRYPQWETMMRNTLKLRENVELDFILTTPFQTISKVEISGKHVGPILRFRNSGSIKLETSHGPINFEQLVDFENFPVVSINSKLITPFKYYKLIQLTASDANLNGLKSSSLLITYNNKEFKLYTKYSLSNGILVDVRLETPIEWCRSLDFKIEYSESAKTFNLKSKLKHTRPEKEIALTVVHSYVRALNTRITLTSPYHDDLDFEAQQSADSDAEKRVKLSLTIGGRKGSGVGELEYQSLTNFNGGLNVITKDKEKYEVTFRHMGGLKGFTSAVKIEKDTQKMVDVMVTYTPESPTKLNAKALLDTPWFETMRVAAKYERHGEKITASASVKKSNQEVASSILVNLGTTRKSVKLIVRTPIPEWGETTVSAVYDNTNNHMVDVNVIRSSEKLLEVSVLVAMEPKYRLRTTVNLMSDMLRLELIGERQDGDLDGKIVMAMNDKEIKIIGRARISTPLTVSIDITTPFSEWKQLTMALKFQNNDNSIETRVSASKESQQISMTASASWLDKYLASVIVNTPIKEWQRLSAKWEMEMRDNFLDSKVSFAREEDIFSLNTRMEMAPRFSAHILVTTPIEEWRRLQLNAKFEMSGTEIITSVIARKMEKTIEVTVHCNRNGRFATIEIKTPFIGWRMMRLFFELDQTRLKVRATNGLKRIALDGIIQMEPRSHVELTIKTPFENFEDVSFTASYSLKNNVVNSGIKIKYMMEKEIEADLTVNYADPKTPSINFWFKTPFTHAKFGQMKIYYQLSGNNKYTGHASMKLESYIITAEFKFQIRPNFEIMGSLKTPFDICENIHFHVQCQKSTRNHFNAEIDINFLQYPLNAKIDYANYDMKRIQLKASLNTPIKGHEQYVAILAYNADMNSLKSTFELLNREKTLISLKGTHNSEQIKSTLHLETPYFIQKINLRGLWKDCSNSLTLTLPGGYVWEASQEFSIDPLKAKLVIRFPRNLVAEISHTGYFSDFKSVAEVTFNGQNCKFELKHSDTEYDLNIQSPLYNLAINHRGQWKDCSTNVAFNSPDGYNWKITQNFVLEPLKVILKLNIPNKLVADFSHTGYNDFKTLAEFAYNGQNYKYVLMHENESRTKCRTSFENPYFTITSTRRGLWEDFTTNWEFSTPNGFRLQANTKFVLDPLSTLLVIRIPDKLVAEFSHAGYVLNFKSIANVVYEGRRTHVGVELHTKDEIKGFAVFTSPFEIFRLGKLEVSIKGSLKKFVVGGLIQWTPTNIIAVQTNLDIGKSWIIGEMNIVTPLFERVLIKINQKYDKHIKVLVEGHYGSQMIQVMCYSDRHHDGYFMLKTPFEHLKDVGVTLRKISISVSDKKGYQVELQLAPARIIKIDIAGDIEDSHQTVYFKMTTPFSKLETVLFNGENQVSENSLKSKMMLLMNSRPIIDMTIDFSKDSKNINIELIVKAPHPIKFTMMVVNVMKHKILEIDFSWNTATRGNNIFIQMKHEDRSTYYRVKKDSIIRLTIPSRTMLVSHSFEQSRLKTNLKMEFAWNQPLNQMVSLELGYVDESRSFQKSYTVIGNLWTPLRVIKTSYKHSSTNTAYSGVVKTSWDAEDNPQNMLEIGMKYNLHGRKRLLALTIKHPHLSQPISIKNEIIVNTLNVIYGGKTVVEYSNDPKDKLVIIGNVKDESRGRRQNITVTVKLSHPKSLADVELNTHVANTNNAASAGLNINYMTARQQNLNVHLFGEIDKMRRSLRIQIKTPNTNVMVNGKMKIRADGYDFFITRLLNDLTSPLKTELHINTDPSFSLRSQYDAENSMKTFHARGELSKSTIVFEAYRINHLQRISDVKISATLNSSRVFKTILKWRPEDVKEIKDYFKSTVSEIRNELDETLTHAQTAIAKEMSARRQILRQTLPDMNDITKYINSEIEKFNSNLNKINEHLELMYESNEFFLKDADIIIEQTSRFISIHAERLIYRLRSKIAEVRRQVAKQVGSYRRMLDNQLGQLEESIAAVVLNYRPAWQSYAYSVWRHTKVANLAFIHKAELLAESIQDTKANLMDYLDGKFDHVTYKIERYMDKFTNLQEVARYYLLSKKQETYLENIRKQLMHMWTNVKLQTHSMKNTFASKANQFWYMAEQSVLTTLEQIFGHEYARIVSNCAEDIVEEVKSTYKQWGVDNDLRFLFSKSVEKLAAQIHNQARYLIKKYMRVGHSGFTVFNPENGHIQGNLFLPLEIESLNAMPGFYFEEWKNELKFMKEKYLPLYTYSPWDTFYKYKPNTDIANWIPPFKAQATVFLGKNFITYDGLHYTFAGTCKYVLAKVFDSNTFTIIANYQRGNLESYHIMSDNQEITLKMTPDLYVTLEQKAVELPLQYSNTTVIRVNNIVRVDNARGLRFECDINRQRCTFYINGWHFGKLGGLFGTYDNEHSNDLTTPQLHTTDSIAHFADTWQIGHSCKGSINLAEPLTHAPSADSVKICKRYFEETTSPLISCFNLVSPKKMYQSCLYSVESSRTDKLQVACAHVDVYFKQCRNYGIDMNLPEQCKLCETKRRPSSQREIASVTPSMMSADIVFVVEQKPCNRQMIGKLGHIAMILQKALHSRGLNDNQFGLVGFGGIGVHDKAHSHTMNNKLFGTLDILRIGAPNMHLEPGTNDNVFDAIRFAAAYPFRPGVGKAIILLPCSNCATCTRCKISETEKLLRVQDIALHVLYEKEFAMAVNTPKASNIIGMDSGTAFTVNDALNSHLLGDPALFQQIVPIKRSCSSVALNSRGSVFNTLKIYDHEVGAEKYFIDVMAQRVAISAKPGERQICKCISDKNGNTKTICMAVPARPLRSHHNTSVQTSLTGDQIRPLQRTRVSYQE